MILILALANASIVIPAASRLSNGISRLVNVSFALAGTTAPQDKHGTTVNVNASLAQYDGAFLILTLGTDFHVAVPLENDQ